MPPCRPSAARASCVADGLISRGGREEKFELTILLGGGIVVGSSSGGFAAWRWASVAQLDRASVFGTDGWGFESLRTQWHCQRSGITNQANPS